MRRAAKRKIPFQQQTPERPSELHRRRPRGRKLASGHINSRPCWRRASSRRKSQKALGIRPRVRRDRVGPLFHRWYQAEAGKYTKPDPLGDLPVTEPLLSPAIDPELFSPLYTYVGNNPTNYIDPLGLLRFKGCTTDQENVIGPAFKDYCQRIESPEFIDCMCESPATPPKLKRLCGNPKVTVRCRQNSGGRCAGACAWATPFGRTIRLCPSVWNPGLCGPLGCTLMHELTHISGRPGEKRSEQVEECLGCP